jgi:hypothetical protein
MAKNIIYLPTVEACTDAGFPRFPAKYKSGSVNTTQREAAKSLGLQYQKFGNTPQGKSLQSLDVVEGFNPRDIVIEVLTNRPYTIKTTTKNGITQSEYYYGKDVPEPEFKFHIAPTTESGFELDISHEHKWESAASIFDKILKGASELIGNVDDFVTKFKNLNLGNGVQGKPADDKAYKATPNRRVDLAETYTETTKQSITIPFVLFTLGGEDNFIRDIYTPITLLTQISYPKRSTKTGSIDNAIANGMGINKNDGGAQGTDGNGQPIDNKEDASTLDAINAINPGFRVFVSDPPSYVNVYHNGGLFSYKNCYIKKFNYKYRLWVDGNGDPLNKTPSGGTITDATLKNARFAYPTVAECSLEIATTEPLFADDFRALGEQYTKNRNSQVRGG